jgi:hypothetical protein
MPLVFNETFHIKVLIQLSWLGIKIERNNTCDCGKNQVNSLLTCDAIS